MKYKYNVLSTKLNEYNSEPFNQLYLSLNEFDNNNFASFELKQLFEELKKKSDYFNIVNEKLNVEFINKSVYGVLDLNTDVSEIIYLNPNFGL